LLQLARLFPVQGVTPVTPTLRILHFKTTDVPVIRQTAPLLEPEQPAGGHRLIYYMLGGEQPHKPESIAASVRTLSPCIAAPFVTPQRIWLCSTRVRLDLQLHYPGVTSCGTSH